MKETVEQSLSLGIELGSTRIKAVAIDEDFRAVSSGDYTWVSRCENGIWTYPLEQVWEGLRAALSGIANRERISAMGISGMMHGYLAFDKDWNLLVPFRTWQNTMTAQAAAELTEVFGFNIPQRWSIAHLYQAVLNGEAHVEKIAHITTLAGFVHYKLTGVNAVGIGEASGIFPIDSTGKCYDKTMLHKFSTLPETVIFRGGWRTFFPVCWKPESLPVGLPQREPHCWVAYFLPVSLWHHRREMRVPAWPPPMP